MKLTFKQKLIVTTISTILSAQAYADCTPALTEGPDGTAAAPVVCTGSFGYLNLDVTKGKSSSDVVTIDGGRASGVYGDNNSSGKMIGSDDTILVKNKSVITGYGIYGEDLQHGSESVGGKDTITVDDSEVSKIYGDDFDSGSKHKGGKDTILVQNNSKVGFIWGEWFKGSDNQGAEDTITVIDSKVGVIWGEWFKGSDNQGAEDTITVIDSTVGDIFGQYFRRVGADNNVGKKDTIIITNSTITGLIYGSLFETGSNNKSEGSNVSVKDSTVRQIYGSYFIKNGDSNSGDNTITIDNSTIKADVVGSWFRYASTGGNKEGKNTITVKNNSNINVLRGSVLHYGSKNIGGENIIEVTSGSTVGVLFVAIMLAVTDSTSAKNTITIDKSKVNSALFGNYFHLSSNKNKSGGSKITVKNSSVVSDVFSDYFSAGTDNIAGDDIINIEDSVARNIYGEYGAGKIISGGNDTLNLKKATVTGKIDMSVGDDTVNYFGNGNTIANDVNGGEGHDRFNVAEYQGKAVDLASNFISFEDFGLVQNTVVDFEDSYTSPKI